MFYKKLLQLSEKPQLFGVESIEDIRVFIIGISESLNLFGGKEDADYKDFQNFQNWIVKRYDAGESSNWVSLIRYNSIGNKDSINLFSNLLKNYLEETIIS